MKLKLIEPGWEGYTGPLGTVDFEDGVSVREINSIEAARISNVVRAETLEGRVPSSSQLALDSKTVPMDAGMVTLGGPAPTAAQKVWTEAELTELADKKGIAGVREIADPLGLKGNSIGKLIAAVLEQQRPGVAAVLPSDEGTEAPVGVKVELEA